MSKRVKNVDFSQRSGERWSKSTTLKSGSKYTTKWGRNFIVGTHLGESKYSCHFGDFSVVSDAKEIHAGVIIHPLDKTVYGVGYIGFGDKSSSTDSKAYKVWQGMFKRVYSGLHQYKAYRHLTVEEDWHCFQNFCKWFYENYIPDTELDKDLGCKLTGTHSYSKRTCNFLPKEVNTMLTNISWNCHVREYKSHVTGKIIYKGALLSEFKVHDSAAARYLIIITKIGLVEGILREKYKLPCKAKLVNKLLYKLLGEGNG